MPLPVLPLVLGQDDLEFRLFTMISIFGTPHDVAMDNIRVETFFPADVATENLLRKLGDTEINQFRINLRSVLMVISSAM